MWLNKDPIEEKGGINLYEFVANCPVNMFDLFGLKIYPTDFIGPILPSDQKGLTCEQYNALKELLNREEKYGTIKAARMSSITFGDALIQPFNSSDGKSIPTYAGDMDLDWFTDVTAWNYVGRYSATPLYVGGKLAWTLIRFVHGDPIGHSLPYGDPTEKVAAIALAEDQNFSSLFTPEFFKHYKPNNCECK